MTADLLAIVVPVFLTAAIGFAWERSGRVFDTDFVTGIVLTIATPCLVFSSLTRLDVSLETLGAIAGSYLAVLVVLGVAGAVVIRSALKAVVTILPAHRHVREPRQHGHSSGFFCFWR